MNNNAVLMHYDGSSWTNIPPYQFFLGLQVDKIWAASPTSAWATGDPALNPMRWDGTKWNIDGSVKFANNKIAVGIWGSGERDVWIATQGNLYHFDGTSWSQDPTVNSTLFSIHGTSTTDVWAGDDRAVWHYHVTPVAGTASVVPRAGRRSDGSFIVQQLRRTTAGRCRAAA